MIRTGGPASRAFVRGMGAGSTREPLLVYSSFCAATISVWQPGGLHRPVLGFTRISSFRQPFVSCTAHLDRGAARAGRFASCSPHQSAPGAGDGATLALVLCSRPSSAGMARRTVPQQSSTALRILAVGVFANSLAHPLFVVLYAKGRPDLPAKFHLTELVIHIPLTILLIRSFGIAGAAAAWTTRVTLDMCLLLWGAAHTSGRPVLEVAGGRVGNSLVGIFLLFGALIASKYLAGISDLASIAAIVATIVLLCRRQLAVDAGGVGACCRQADSALLPEAAQHGSDCVIFPLR